MSVKSEQLSAGDVGSFGVQTQMIPPISSSLIKTRLTPYELMITSQLSNIVYTPEDITYITDHGGRVLHQVIDDGFVAMAVVIPDRQHKRNRQYLVFRGTPLGYARSLKDMMDALECDLSTEHTADRYGHVLTMIDQHVRKHLPEMSMYLHPTWPLTITGHSLGGCMALIAPRWITPTHQAVRSIAYAPFQCADSDYWEHVYPIGGGNMYAIIGREQDFSLGWNHLDPVTCHPGPIYHLTRHGDIHLQEKWNPLNLDVFDHSIELYCQDIDTYCRLVKDMTLPRHTRGLHSLGGD